jgi:hypothetical protein
VHKLVHRLKAPEPSPAEARSRTCDLRETMRMPRGARSWASDFVGGQELVLDAKVTTALDARIRVRRGDCAPNAGPMRRLAEGNGIAHGGYRASNGRSDCGSEEEDWENLC